jgi:hypothetical protein
LCTKEEYEKWLKGELYFREYASEGEKRFLDKEDIKKVLEGYLPDEHATDEILQEEGIFSREAYDEENDELESFEGEYTTPSGETVVAFGRYGYNG